MQVAAWIVGRTGIEPVTSCLSSKRSPAELTPHGPIILSEPLTDDLRVQKFATRRFAP